MKTPLIVLALAAFFICAFLYIDNSKDIQKESFAAYSIFNSSPVGLSQAYKYLSLTGYDSNVGVITRPIDRMKLRSDTLVFRINPESSIPPGLQRPVKGH